MHGLFGLFHMNFKFFIWLPLFEGGLALLSLDCVQMSEAKKKMAVLSGILVIVGGNLIHIVAVWFTILHLPIGGTRGDIGAFVGSRIDLDVYDATPGKILRIFLIH